MNITISTRHFLGILTTLVKVVPTRASIPALENILMDATEAGLTLTASDGSTSLRTSIEATATPEVFLEVASTGRSLVPARLLLDVVKAVSDDTVTLDFEAGNSLRVSWKSGAAYLPTFSAVDYPEIDKPLEGTEATEVSLPADELLSAINATLYAAASDEIRPQLCGIHFDFSPDGSAVVATDTRRMACFSIAACTEVPAAFTLPKRDAAVLKGILTGDTPVTITFTDTGIAFAANGTVLLSRAVAGKYPNWKGVLPKANPFKLTMDRVQLLTVIRRVSICSNPATGLIRFDLSSDLGGGTIVLSAQDLGFGVSAKETVGTEYSGDNLTIGFKSLHVVETLSAMTAQKVTLLFKGERNAVLVSSADEEKQDDPSYGVLMPVLVK